MRLPFIVSVLLLLSACSTSSVVEEGVPRLVGKDIAYAIKYLGYPDDEINVDGKKVYLWQDAFTRSGTITTYKPQYTTTYTRSGGVTSYSTLQDDEDVSFSGSCKIRLITIKGKIVDTNLEGNDYGCDKYVEKVEKLIEDMTPSNSATEKPK